MQILPKQDNPELSDSTFRVGSLYRKDNHTGNQAVIDYIYYHKYSVLCSKFKKSYINLIYVMLVNIYFNNLTLFYEKF